MSPGCFEIWEISGSDIEGDATKLWEEVYSEDLNDMQASVQRSAETMSKWEHRWRIKTPSGKKKWLQGVGIPRREADGSILWNSMILDITIEVTAQEKLNENLKRLNEVQKQDSIGRIAAGIAHDFNNLMGIVLGNAEILLSEPGPADRKSLSEICAAAKRGGELTKRLLSFARKSELAPKVSDLNQLVLGMNDLINRTIPENVHVKTTLMAGLWPTKVDVSLLESSLLNLTLNARDAMPNGGILTIETANVRISQEYIDERAEDLRPGRYVMMAVTDTGSGIDKTMLPSIFEPFFTTKGPDNGTGLGLSMVEGFAKQSGGAVRAYSEPGEGTSIKIYLQAHSAEESFEREASRVFSSEKIVAHVLLAEDEKVLRTVMRRSLESSGLTVSDAESGDHGYEIFLKDPDAFDLIVTDIIMPGALQGPMMVRKIREVRSDLPVVYVSGYPHEASVHGNGVRANDTALTKPIDRATLISAVQNALKSSSGN